VPHLAICSNHDFERIKRKMLIRKWFSNTRLLVPHLQQYRSTIPLRNLSSSTIHVPIGKAYDEKEAKKYLQFTCTHEKCEQTLSEDKIVRKYISTLAYEKGVVLVRCNCDKLHLIADRLVRFI
jgi:hypothetical protein